MHIIPAKLFYLILLDILVNVEVALVALPFAKKFLLPAVKSIDKDLIANTSPELVEVVSKKKSPKQAALYSAFEQWIGPLYVPNESTLEFVVTGDRTSFIGLQNIYLGV